MVVVEEILSALKSADLLSNQRTNLGCVGTGSYALNKVLSGKYSGGMRVGGFLEIWGESSTGKTIFLSHIFKEAQKLGYYTGIADNEFSYDSNFAKLMGVDPEKLLYYPGETVPDCFAWMEKVIKEIRQKDLNTPIVLGLDSMAGQGDEEREKDSVGEFNNMDGARRAGEISATLRRFNPLLYKNKVLVVLINQTRSKVGVMNADPTTKSGGGKSLEFYCAASIKLTSNKTSDVILDSGKQPEGIQGRIKCTKNKTSVPFRQCTFKLSFESGLDPYFGLTEWLVKDGILEQKGAGWYTYEPTGAKFQGGDNIRSFIESNEDIQKFLKDN